MLALLHNGTYLQEVAEGCSFDLPDGRVVSPAYSGWFSVAVSEPVEEGEPQPEDVPDGYSLATIAAADAVPASKRVVSTSVEMISGAPKYVHVLADMTEAEIWAPVRAERDARLATCDWTQLADAPLAAEVKSAWATYRQALRDLPETQTDPVNVVWPTEPA